MIQEVAMAAKTQIMRGHHHICGFDSVLKMLNWAIENGFATKFKEATGSTILIIDIVKKKIQDGITDIPHCCVG